MTATATQNSRFLGIGMEPPARRLRHSGHRSDARRSPRILRSPGPHALREFLGCQLVPSPPPAPAFFQRLRLLPHLRRSGRRSWRHRRLARTARPVAARARRLLRRHLRNIRYLWPWPKPSASSTFRSTNSPICSSPSARIRPSRASRLSTMCWRIATTRRIRSAISFSISADTATPSASSFPTSPAPRCNSRTSGRTSASTTRKAASICRSKIFAASA